jgi:transcriptional regulator with XRE-family HTH domain
MRGLQIFALDHRLLNKQLAEAAGISESAISQILGGSVNPSKPTIDKLLAFCKTIDPNVTYETLFGTAESAA